MSFCYQKNFSNPTLPVDEAQFYALVRAGKWNEDIDKFRETGDASLKRKLPAFIFQATFDETESAKGKKGAWRKQKATRLTGLVVMDLDHIDNPMTLYQGWIEKGLDFKALGIVLIYVSPSGKGLKIVFKARLAWGNLISNIHAMAHELGDDIVVDESGKDASRMSFICKESDILYIDKELFTYENKEFAEKYNAEYRAGHSGAAKTDAVAHETGQQVVGQSGSEDDKNVEINWREYDIQRIIDERYGAKLPCAADSNRHNESLKLASDLLVLFDGDRRMVQQVLERQPWVQEIIAERNENVAQTVASAAERMAEREKKYLTQCPSKAMQEAIVKACGQSWKQITQGEEATDSSIGEEDIEKWLWDWGEKIEELFPYYPAMADACKGLKRNQYPAALHVSILSSPLEVA